MLQLQKKLVLSPYLEIFDILIPKDHFLRRLHDEIDFSFIYEELADSYSACMGRTACDPIQMFKYIVLKVLSDLSDKDLVEEVKMNMAYKFFLDMAPEEMPVDSSTLCVFRRQRLKGKKLLDLLLARTMELGLQKGILKTRDDGRLHVNVIVDGTHTVSSACLYRPVPALKEYSKKLRAQLYRCDQSLSGKIENDHNIGSTDLTGEIAYGYRLVGYIEENLPELLEITAVKRIFNRFSELLDDIVNHYDTSLGDPDARVGHKSADTEFFGYKSQILMDEESRLILGAEVTSGEVGDAVAAKDAIEDLAKDDGIVIEELLGDTAYSGQPILELGTKYSFNVIAPPHPILGSGIDGRDGFTFNKDADMFMCPKGHLAVSKRTVTYKNDNNRKSVIYRFDKAKCTCCPMREVCLKGANEKTFSVTALTEEQKDLLRRRQTDHFKERRRQRYKIEAKNAHLKQGLGFGKTMAKGIEMMELQAAVTFFVSNLKIIFAKK